MKRRQRKTVLDINGESDSPRRRWPNERQTQNGSPSNPLATLVGHYNSDSEAEDDSKPRSHKLNDQVNDFLKEIQSIAPEESKKGNQKSSMSHPGSYWQECYDEQTGFPYYWHTETNQVTWEIPAELKMLHEKGKTETATSHSSHIPQWPNVAPNKYSQSPSNIPEGMIPKEVVARNRNRQAGIINKPDKPLSRTDSRAKSGYPRDDSSDDGKIEMITSFGNESESEESEHEEPILKPPSKPASILKKPSTKVRPPVERVNVEPSDTRPVGPDLPPMQYGPSNREKLSERLGNNVPFSRTVVTGNEEDILARLKNQARLLQKRRDNNAPQNSLETRSEKDLKLSLVPGYEDDSEGEEEQRRPEGRPLFPISDSNEFNSGDKLAKKINTNTGSIRIYEYRGSELQNKNEQEIPNDDIKDEDQVDDTKVDHESKANKFLESIDAPTKAFQRKRRIAFDVAPNKGKTQESSTKDETVGNTVPLPDNSERRGLGFSEASRSPEAESMRSDAESSKKSTIAFVKGTTEEPNKNSNSTSDKPKEISETEKAEVKALTEPIMEKLKFLSEGSPAASAVQVMAIQIQTLLSAWESGDLKESYLRNWLVGTGCELTRLEQTAAPPGWECQWDRSHKRYYYRNTSTNEAQWTYPQTDIVGGTEEMELCTTPPPPEQEESPIIEMSAQAATMSTGPSTGKIEGIEQPPSSGSAASESAPPPPPVISSPSPPPPPRIYAEDLKRGRKRKGSPEASDNKSGTEEVSVKEGKPPAEPLPPGVDPPELAAYALSTSALDAGVLYGAQQAATNPIYAATLAGTHGIPILSQHHAALMQGQLMHYNPAYHQHLHNQALVAARLSGQEAVQFMVAEYARVYENNQVIAKPPVKMPQETSLGSAINSFYSDIASIEKNSVEIEKERIEQRLAEAAPSPIPQTPPIENDPNTIDAKDKKKKKLKTGIGKKQKEMSSMVAKWQRAQKNYKEGH